MKITSVKPDGIPFFVALFGALVAILGIALGITGLLNPASAVGFIENAEMLAGTWAGKKWGKDLVKTWAGKKWGDRKSVV